MSTSSQRARRAAAAAEVINPGGTVQGASTDNRAMRLAAIEVAAMQAVAAATRVAAAAEATAATTATL